MADLVAKGLSKRYGRHPVFSGVGFTLPEGGLLCLAGPSGGGKTTLLKVLCGLLLPSDGQLLYGGAVLSTKNSAVAPHRRGMALAFQTPALFPHMTVWQNLCYAAGGRAGHATADDDELRRLCARLHIDDIRDSLPQQVSGGQAKRAELARALAAKPKLLLLDEPTAHLDPALRDEVVDVILDSAKTLGAAVLYVTHDAAELARLDAPVLTLRDGGLHA